MYLYKRNICFDAGCILYIMYYVKTNKNYITTKVLKHQIQVYRIKNLLSQFVFSLYKNHT